jgi:2-amino-4-hydroxy-6-hydroxymethyldihydropteridine diphosphokinase
MRFAASGKLILMEQHVVYLALGSNLGNRAANLKEAIASLPPQVEVKARSAVYETPPIGFADQDMFLNQVIRGETYLQPELLLKHLKRLEIALGRKPSFENGPRLIDMDILFYDDLVLYSTALTIPHPRLHERGFVLVPLLDIAAELEHPVKKKSVRELALFADVSGIRKFGE